MHKINSLFVLLFCSTFLSLNAQLKIDRYQYIFQDWNESTLLEPVNFRHLGAQGNEVKFDIESWNMKITAFNDLNGASGQSKLSIENLKYPDTNVLLNVKLEPINKISARIDHVTKVTVSICGVKVREIYYNILHVPKDKLPTDVKVTGITADDDPLCIISFNDDFNPMLSYSIQSGDNYHINACSTYEFPLLILIKNKEVYYVDLKSKDVCKDNQVVAKKYNKMELKFAKSLNPGSTGIAFGSKLTDLKGHLGTYFINEDAYNNATSIITSSLSIKVKEVYGANKLRSFLDDLLLYKNTQDKTVNFDKFISNIQNGRKANDIIIVGIPKSIKGDFRACTLEGKNQAKIIFINELNVHKTIMLHEIGHFYSLEHTDSHLELLHNHGERNIMNNGSVLARNQYTIGQVIKAFDYHFYDAKFEKLILPVIR